jgi:hemoglobin/transferrin/lactoferrin receptor protein
MSCSRTDVAHPHGVGPTAGRPSTAVPLALLAAVAFATSLATEIASAQAPADSTATPPVVQSAPPAVPSPVASSFADTTKPVTFLREIVVTGARYPRAYYESPQALSFVSRTQMLEQAPTVLGDVLGTLPGVDMSKDSPWEQRPILRGLGGQRVLVMMDGSPINSARGNGPHPSLVDPSQVDRVEVVRGPSSVAYGSDALGGAINIITRDPVLPEGEAFRGAASVGGSTVDNQRNGYLELMPRLGKLTAFLSTGGRKALDYDLPSASGITQKVLNSRFKDYNALANLRYTLTPHMALRGSYQLYRGKDIGLPGLTANIPAMFFQEFSFPVYERDAANLSLEHAYPDAWVSKTLARVTWQREHRDFFSHEEFNTDFLGPHPPSERTRITNQDRFFDLDTWGFQTQFTSRKTARYLVSAGLDLARDGTDGDNTLRRSWVDAYGATVRARPDSTTASVPDGTFGSYATYAQSEWYLGPQWTASVGGRFTHYRYRTLFGHRVGTAGTASERFFPPLKVDDGALCGSLGIVYSPVKDLHVTANVANGYRQPNAQDLFFNGPASVGTVLGNPDLKPEKSISYDLGLRWGPGSFGFAGNLFYSSYDDLIDAIDVTPSGTPAGAPHTYQYVNITKARIWGGDLEAEYRFLRRFQARIGMAGAIGDITNADAILRLYGVVQEQAPLPSIPPFKGTAALRWRDASGRFWVEPSARWSWRTNRLPLPTPGVSFFTEFKKEWMVGDLMAGVRLPAGQRAVVGVRNLADRSYRQAIGSIDEPGRSFVGSLSVDF